MFEKNRIIDLTVDLLMQRFQHCKRGELIKHEIIEATANLTRYQGSWGTIIKKLKRRMLDERKIQLFAVHGVGYKLLTPAQQLHDAPFARQRRAARQLKWSRDEVEAIPISELSPHDQQTKALKIEHLSKAKKQIDNNTREQRALLEPPERNPSMQTPQGKASIE